MSRLSKFFSFCRATAVVFLVVEGWISIFMPNILVLVIPEGSSWVAFRMDFAARLVSCLVSWFLAYFVLLEQLTITEVSGQDGC